MTLAVILFLLGIVFLLRSNGDSLPDRRALGTVLLVGLILLVLSFPAYLILESARSLWRTQILASFGAGLFMAAAIGLCASYVTRNWLRIGAIAALGALVIGYGSFSAVKKAAFHEWVWERQHSAMARMLEIAPRLKAGTRVILTDVPRGSDPFLEDNMWFDMALHLAYPGTKVSGRYFYDGDASIEKANADTILLDYRKDGRISIADGREQIENGPPSPLAVRRYGK